MITIDIETKSDKDISKCGVYAYTDTPYFDILLFAYSIDGQPVQVVDAVNDTAQAEQLSVILAAPVLAESHIRNKVRFDEVVVVVNELAVCLAVKVKIQLFLVMVCELRFEELVHKVLVALSDRFENSLRVILSCADIADGETIHEPRYQTAATEHGIVNHTVKDVRLTSKADAHVGLFQHNARPGRSVADVGLAVPRL